jgi:flavin-dependent dehydrogenase
MLVGDAAGFYDPFTGEGLYTALRSAELLADTATTALRVGDCGADALAAYTDARHALFAAKERLTHVLQVVIRHRRLANLAARVLARRPAVLDLLLGVLGDFVPAGALLDPRWLRRSASA